MLRPDMGQHQKAFTLFRSKRLMRSQELAEAGIHPQTLARMAKAGTITKVARGLYRLREDGNVDDLAEAAAQVPNGVLCLVSALQFHQLTLQMPHTVWMAIAESSHKPQVAYPPVQFVRFGRKSFDLDAHEARVDGVQVRVYSPAKTVVDCFRYRKRIGLDVALEGLTSAIRSGKAKPSRVAEIARELRIWSVMRPYLEAIVTND